MLAGSLFGWACPAAQTSSYDLKGQFIRPDKGKAKAHKPQEAAR